MLRLALALSVLPVALAVAFDVATLVPHSVIQITAFDGRQATVPLQVPTAYVRADPKLIRTLLASEVSIASPAVGGAFAPGGVSAAEIRDVVVVQGPEYRWWADSQLTLPAVLFVVSLWIGIFVLRRVVRAIVS